MSERLRKLDAFLLFFLISLIPIAFPLGMSPRAEHVLFKAWCYVQLVALFAAGALVLYGMARGPWSDWLVLLTVGAALLVANLSFTFVEWDAQIEYHRVILLARRYGGLWNAYRHGVTGWILGYPPGTSLSAMWYPLVKMRSPNQAQGVLMLLWSGSFLVRHLRGVDLPGKLLFFLLLLATPLLQWHMTYFYNNLFYALLWGQLILVPMLGSSLQPWERCAIALVMIWLRPQWPIAAVAIGSGALTSALSAKLDRRSLRELAVVTVAALAVAWLGAVFWQHKEHALELQQAAHNEAVVADIMAHQEGQALTVVVKTHPTEQNRTPPPPIFSAASKAAIAWAYEITTSAHALSLLLLEGFTLLGLVTLGRRGLDFLVPILSPLALVVGTALFARAYPEYRANAGAIERLQLIIPVLTAGVATALHVRVKRWPA